MALTVRIVHVLTKIVRLVLHSNFIYNLDKALIVHIVIVNGCQVHVHFDKLVSTHTIFYRDSFRLVLSSRIRWFAIYKKNNLNNPKSRARSGFPDFPDFPEDLPVLLLL